MSEIPASADTVEKSNTSSGPLRWGVGAAVIAALAIAAYFGLKGPAKAPAAEANGVKVDGELVIIAKGAPQWQYLEVLTAAMGTAIKPLPVPGRVEFDENRSASVGVPLPGRVENVLVRFGDRVKKGQKLISVRSGAFADLDRELASAREGVEVKKRVLDRLTDLVKLQAAPEKEQIAAAAELKEAELQLKAALAKHSSLSVSSDGDNLFWVTAPRDGTVVEHDVFVSQEVGPDREKPLLRISDLGEVLVIGDVAERDAGDLKPGQEVDIVSELGSTVKQGVIERVSEVVDPRRHTVEIRIRVKNEDRFLRPNAFVEATFSVDPNAKYIVVPSEAVVTEGERAMIFVQNENGTLRRTPVKPGRARDGSVEIRTGLEPGTKFIGKGALLLLNQVDLAAN